MNIMYDVNKFILTLSDEEKSKWRDGDKVFWKMPKETNDGKGERPDWNPYDAFGSDGSDQAVYRLGELAHGFPVNQTPKEIEDVYNNARLISRIYHQYMNHALAVCLDPDGKYNL